MNAPERQRPPHGGTGEADRLAGEITGNDTPAVHLPDLDDLLDPDEFTHFGVSRSVQAALADGSTVEGLCGYRRHPRLNFPSLRCPLCEHLVAEHDRVREIAAGWSA